jgi:hypothetical protein
VVSEFHLKYPLFACVLRGLAPGRFVPRVAKGRFSIRAAEDQAENKFIVDCACAAEQTWGSGFGVFISRILLTGMAVRSDEEM